MKTLSSKIFIGFILVIIIFTGLILIFTFHTTKNHYINTFTDDLKHINTTIIDLSKPYILIKDFHGLNDYITSLGKKINTRITIIDTNGVVLSDSKKDPSLMENHKNRPEISEVLSNRNNYSRLRYSATLHDEMLYVASPIFDGKKLIAVSRVSIFLSDINQLNTKILTDILQIAIVVIIFSLIAILIYSYNLTKPIKLLSKASRKVALGDFDTKVYISGRDEIVELAKNFNKMTDKLKDLFLQVTTQKDSYTALISSILEGLVVIDNFGKILLYNKAFQEICHKDEIDSKLFWDVLPNKEFSELIDEAEKSKKHISREIVIFDTYYLCSASFIESKSEIVILLHNITEIKKLEMVKREFVVNVSHELRTPLTAIKGFVETLLDDAEDTSQHYLEIINRHTDRLINIVQDLLSLSEVEDKNIAVKLSKVDIRVLTENIIKLFETKATVKGLKLILQIEEGFPKIKVDPFKIEQVFINLIDNAIKYTDEGYVKVNIYQRDERAVLEVIDSGKSIPKEHYSRIFERFYTIDKSHSRKLGGTGLGLSIVKHIVLLHNGEISLDSNNGNGNKFIVSLPLKSKKR